MKIKILVILLLIVVVGVVLAFNKHETQTPMLVGNDLDAHNCKASAGYTYSVVKDSCIRIFESGIRLDPQDAVADKTTSAFVVFKNEEEDLKVEVFVPTATSSIILSKMKDNGAGTWGNETYKLTQWKGMYTLEDKNGRILYQGLQTRASDLR